MALTQSTADQSQSRVEDLDQSEAKKFARYWQKTYLWIVHIVIDNYSVISKMIVICQLIVNCECDGNHTQMHIPEDTMWYMKI